MKKPVLIAAAMMLALSCSKKETTVEIPVETKTESYSQTVSKNNSLDTVSAENPEVGSQDEVADTDDHSTTGEFSGDGRVIKFTERYDAEGNEVIVISKIGKKDKWLYQTLNNPNIYEFKEEGITVTKNGSSYVLSENGKTTTFNVK